jgi:hypothetical protein
MFIRQAFSMHSASFSLAPFAVNNLSWIGARAHGTQVLLCLIGGSFKLQNLLFILERWIWTMFEGPAAKSGSGQAAASHFLTMRASSAACIPGSRSLCRLVQITSL